MALTRNRLIEMMSNVSTLEREINNFPLHSGAGPFVLDRQKHALNYMRNQIAYLRAVLESQLDLTENRT